jgi:predicted nucleic acid-binding protein
LSGANDFPDPEVAYLDSSAVVKLVHVEAESSKLRAWLTGWPTRATSALTRLEVLRAVRRGSPGDEERARAVLRTLEVIAITDGLLRRAEVLGDVHLGPLDAVQLATAIEISADVLVAYDRRLIASARAAGLRVEGPGAQA